MPDGVFTDKGSVSARKTPFVPRFDDEETLWAVHEITAESDTQYKVKWAGEDPRTGKPWPQSWVPKDDCTDDLVVKWEAKMKCKGEGLHKHGRDNGSVECQPMGRPKRKRQPEEDVSEATDDCEKATAETASKIHKQEVGPLKATRSNRARPSKPASVATQSSEIGSVDGPLSSHPPIKVGPPRGVRNRASASRRAVATQSSEVCSADGPPSSHPPIKVGPPRGAHSKSSAHPQLFPPISAGASAATQPILSPVARLSQEVFSRTTRSPGDYKSTETGENSATDVQALTVCERQSFMESPGSSAVESNPSQAMDWRRGPVASTGQSSGASGTAGPARKAIGDLKARFIGIEANMLTLHGLVKKADVQLEEAMKELREFKDLLK